MEKPQVTRRQFVEARKDPTEMLDLVDETFNQMALTVQPAVVVAGLFGALVRRNDRNRPLLDNPIDQRLSGIATIRNHVLSRQAFQQGLRLSAFVRLSCRQPDPQRIPQTVHRDMDFGAEPTATTPQRLLLLSAAFFVRLPRTDVPAQSWRLPARFPYPVRWQSAQTFAPRRLLHTNERSAYRRCSNFHIQQAATAIALRCAISTARLRQSADTFVTTRLLPAGNPAGTAWMFIHSLSCSFTVRMRLIMPHLSTQPSTNGYLIPNIVRFAAQLSI